MSKITMTYSEQLRHPNWQKKRLEKLEGAGWACSSCDDTENTLHVHHRQYFKGRMAWEYDAAQLIVLCEHCHAQDHQVLEVMKGFISYTNTDENTALIAGFHSGADWIPPDDFIEARSCNPLAYAAGFVAMLTYGLDIEDMLKVAAYAASLHSENAEDRLRFQFGRGDTFGEIK